MGKSTAAPPSQAANAVPPQARLPEPMDIPTVPENAGMPELTAPTFPELSLPSATEAAMADMPDLPAADLPDVFGI
ncbi:MAG: hypothetical protein OEN23_15100 [Paracoccaceae bacterium]|nr:hypothetical protein [Paracoccaceae bacterium]